MLWYTLNESQLSSIAHQLVINQNNEILISPASYREIAIKISIGKLILQFLQSISIRRSHFIKWGAITLRELKSWKNLPKNIIIAPLVGIIIPNLVYFADDQLLIPFLLNTTASCLAFTIIYLSKRIFYYYAHCLTLTQLLAI